MIIAAKRGFKRNWLTHADFKKQKQSQKIKN